MKQAHKALAAGLLTAASLGIMGSTSQAVVYVESPADAGQTLPTADSTGTDSTTALTEITGAFNTASDADLYAFTITSPTTFSASTINDASDAQDTELFLFSAAGTAIAVNDDAPGGTTLDSMLPAGNALYATLAAGTYFLGISESGNEAINSAGQVLFAPYPGGDTTAVRGAAGGVNPTTEDNFNSGEFDTTTFGAYEIDLTGAATAVNPDAVPEPSTWATVALGGVVAAFTLLRRRRAA